MPAPTVLVAQRIRRATAGRRPVLLVGTTMGGGPSHWAARDHARAGLPLYATPEAARTFDDDLTVLQRELGLRVVSDDEAARLRGVERIRLRDLELDRIGAVFRSFGVELELDGLVVGVFDHGEAPPGTSDRLFRLQYLAERLRQGSLESFAYRAEDIPASMTRMRGVARVAREATEVPVVVMDTGPAAALGALEDPDVRAQPESLVVNVGTFHTLAFRFRGGLVGGLFEHHTGLLDRARLEDLLEDLARGTIDHETVFQEHGHGAWTRDRTPSSPSVVAVTGPRRALLKGSRLPVRFPAPYGDQMLTGCFGMLRAAASVVPDWQGRIEEVLRPSAQTSTCR
ncbi:MAG TPA: DUF1786 domain-containing protein [Actinomycetota bacterium]|nr:DUF1786 domain-containing protein [Actinomycetota bacterium]